MQNLQSRQSFDADYRTRCGMQYVKAYVAQNKRDTTRHKHISGAIDGEQKKCVKPLSNRIFLPCPIPSPASGRSRREAHARSGTPHMGLRRVSCVVCRTAAHHMHVVHSPVRNAEPAVSKSKLQFSSTNPTLLNETCFMLRAIFTFCTPSTMSPPAPSTSKAGATAYASDKPHVPLPPIKTTKRSTTITGTKQAMAEINYPDPLPGGFQPGKKTCEQLDLTSLPLSRMTSVELGILDAFSSLWVVT
ncbi:hypothetical protein CIB48_g10201 [Xylaria polymorpha]|nr:hypothetical protein CIB48_g10201 [Xylaria polymorpha]